jgi:hypothetical protein
MTGRQEYDRTKDRQRILGKYMIDLRICGPNFRCGLKTSANPQMLYVSPSKYTVVPTLQ